LKQSVQNAVYEQKDPLLIYKLESFNLFKQMLGDVGKEITQFLMKGNLPTQNQDQPQATIAPKAAPVKTESKAEVKAESKPEPDNSAYAKRMKEAKNAGSLNRS
jgi:preprotein translocase subunit SecA